ncbi:MAG: DnaA regulatory inactivator Hda [Gammaproteobacteria bacterium]|nr:DnaA regulatory inactivator Hda [Gammaproteobacteria bacterium]
MQQLPLGVRLRDRALFASYFPGPNSEALAHLEAVAGGTRAGTTWLCGAAGTGKTHLLQAACARAGESAHAGYFPLGDNVRLGVAALEGWERLDCVCLDDLDAIVGRQDWELQVFALYREAEERGARLVVAATAPPALLEWSVRDLGSRFAAGTILQLCELGEAGQEEALRWRARARGLELPHETVRYLQRRFPRDMHTLYRLLDTLDDAALAAQRRLTVPFIRSVLADWR